MQQHILANRVTFFLHVIMLMLKYLYIFNSIQFQLRFSSTSFLSGLSIRFESSDSNSTLTMNPCLFLLPCRFLYLKVFAYSQNIDNITLLKLG